MRLGWPTADPMRNIRVFQPGPLRPDSRVELDPAAANHVSRVLRLREGAQLSLFDGSGGEYPATLVQVERRRVEVQLHGWMDCESESPLDVTLVQGVSKGERMDYAVQKATELGVRRIVPVETDHGVVSLDPSRWEKKRNHWQRVAVSACEQCGRNRIPEVAPVTSLKTWLCGEPTGLGLFLDPGQPESVGTLTPVQAVTLVIGPEGGLSDEERRLAASRGYRGIRLGPRVLRTETAAIAALAVLQLSWGDLG